jgi:hypothetical protein
MGISDNFEREIAWPSEYQNAEDAGVCEAAIRAIAVVQRRSPG